MILYVTIVENIKFLKIDNVSRETLNKRKEEKKNEKNN